MAADGGDDEPCDHTEHSSMDALQAQALDAPPWKKDLDLAHWEVSTVEVQELVTMALMKSELKRMTEPYSYFKASRTRPQK